MSFAYLDSARASEFFADLKVEMLGALSPQPGARIADVGCGTGEDAAAAAAAADDVFAVGFDLSAEHAAEARRRHRRAPAAYVVADAHELPLADASLDGCLVERTLQHVADPRRVAREIARGLRPGGRLVVSEPDWRALALTGADPDIGAAVLGHWIQRNRHPTIGRELPGVLVAAGLRVASVRCRSVIYRDLPIADAAFPLRRAADSAVREQLVLASDADAWIADLERASDNGGFVLAIPLFTAVATKP